MIKKKRFGGVRENCSQRQKLFAITQLERRAFFLNIEKRSNKKKKENRKWERRGWMLLLQFAFQNKRRELIQRAFKKGLQLLGERDGR